jgi:hypothetical protein
LLVIEEGSIKVDSLFGGNRDVRDFGDRAFRFDSVLVSDGVVFAGDARRLLEDGHWFFLGRFLLRQLRSDN